MAPGFYHQVYDGGGRVIWHNGSNTLWYTLVALVPSRNTVIVIVTNDGNLEKA